MKRYLYNYQTILRFSTPVSNHFFCLRCMPCVNACQQASRRELFVHPSDGTTYGADVWGNPIQYGHRTEPHDAFVFVSSGEARITPYRIPATPSVEMFKVASTLTALSPAMREFLNAVPRQRDTLQDALALAEQLYHTLRYTPGSTRVDTPAHQAFAQRQGVCQDYAHLLVALCRARGMAARYANGFMQGIGETHAWAEVLDDEGYWRGIDPTHNQLIDYGYIKLSHGRDALDCPVNRGVFHGTAMQQREIRVIVEEI